MIGAGALVNDLSALSEGVKPESLSSTGHIFVLGGGEVVREYYLPALDMLGMLESTTVVDRSEQALAGLSIVWPTIDVQRGDFHEFFADMYNHSDNAFVIVALPNSLHVEASLLALQSGFDVLCDKPLAMHAEECAQLQKAADSYGRIIGVNMCRRYLPSVVAVRQALRDGFIGDLLSVDIEDGAPYAWTPTTAAPFRKENGGVLADMGVHYLDLVESLVGNIRPVAYWDDYAGGVEANARYELQTATGIPVKLALSRTRTLQNRITIYGTRGTLTAHKDTFDACVWSSDAGLDGRFAPRHPFGENWPPALVSCFAQQIVDFRSAVRHRSAPSVNASDASSVIEAIEWAYQQHHWQPSQPDVSIQLQPHGRPLLPDGRVVITGGTGFIGTHLIERLATLGFKEIVVPVRRITSSASVARFPISLREVDLLDLEAVREVVADARWVFHLAYGRDGKDAEQVTTRGTRNVVEAAVAAGCECVVALSTIYVFGDCDAEVNEGYPNHPKGGRYGSEKAKMEAWCLHKSLSSMSTRIVILNPSCVFGPGGKTYAELPYQLARDGLFAWIEDGRGIANYTYVDNLVDAIVLAASRPEGHGHRFIINDGYETWRNFLSPLIQDFGRTWPSYTRDELIALDKHKPRPDWGQALQAALANPRVREVLKTKPPTSGAIQLLRRLRPDILEHLRAHKGIMGPSGPSAPALPPVWVADLFAATPTRFSSEKARGVLGWQPLVSLANGQETTRHWLAAQFQTGPST